MRKLLYTLFALWAALWLAALPLGMPFALWLSLGALSLSIIALGSGIGRWLGLRDWRRDLERQEREMRKGGR